MNDCSPVAETIIIDDDESCSGTSKPINDVPSTSTQDAERILKKVSSLKKLPGKRNILIPDNQSKAYEGFGSSSTDSEDVEIIHVWKSSGPKIDLNKKRKKIVIDLTHDETNLCEIKPTNIEINPTNSNIHVRSQNPGNIQKATYSPEVERNKLQVHESSGIHQTMCSNLSGRRKTVRHTDSAVQVNSSLRPCFEQTNSRCTCSSPFIHENNCSIHSQHCNSHACNFKPEKKCLRSCAHNYSQSVQCEMQPIPPQERSSTSESITNFDDEITQPLSHCRQPIPHRGIPTTYQHTAFGTSYRFEGYSGFYPQQNQVVSSKRIVFFSPNIFNPILL